MVINFLNLKNIFLKCIIILILFSLTFEGNALATTICERGTPQVNLFKHDCIIKLKSATIFEAAYELTPKPQCKVTCRCQWKELKSDRFCGDQPGLIEPANPLYCSFNPAYPHVNLLNKYKNSVAEYTIDSTKEIDDAFALNQDYEAADLACSDYAKRIDQNGTSCVTACNASIPTFVINHNIRCCDLRDVTVPLDFTLTAPTPTEADPNQSY